jgi:hypothetical protein
VRIQHLLVAVLALVVHPACSFAPLRPATGSRSSSFSLTSKEGLLVEDLFHLVQEDTHTPSTTEESQDIDEKVSDILQQLEGSFVAPDEDEDPNRNRFDPLVGYYNVSYTLKAQQKDNPVGGKWTRTTGIAQKFLRTRRTLQHILPTNTTGLVQDPKAVAEAVNVIALEALFGLIRLTVILRGDAVPIADAPPSDSTNSNKPLLPNLSNLAVRAYFDPPRIVFGKKGRLVNVNIGPTSSVVLDAPYFDSKVRVGLGGTSGTKFVFARCREDDEEAKEFLPLLQRKPVSKRKATMVLLSVAGTGIFGALRRGFQVTGSLAAVTSLLSLGLVLSSSGGIERREDTYQPGK